ncbi:ATP-binding cassette domain-containing protein [Spirillospora sp. NPDC029432]|uniref:ATP-binding cassette domain-containing protein n=1 Tax=Spirillospora sp. NPDC029432 TaxID=3154599 RepID=UPI0034567818
MRLPLPLRCESRAPHAGRCVVDLPPFKLPYMNPAPKRRPGCSSISGASSSIARLDASCGRPDPMQFPEIQERFMGSTEEKPATDELLRLQDVGKVYGRSRNRVAALAGVSLGFQRRTFTAVMGPSGSGKSTFLHCAALLDRPTSGRVFLGGEGSDGVERARADQAAQESDRVRLPEFQSAARAERGGQRDAAAAAGG